MVSYFWIRILLKGFYLKTFEMIRLNPAWCIGLLILVNTCLSAQISSIENIEQWNKAGLKSSLKGFVSDFYNFGDPFQMAGGLAINLRSYNVSGIPPRQDPFFYSIGANLNFKIYQIDLPFSMIITAKNSTKSYPNLKELLNSFKDQAKSKLNGYARFGISPHYKWMKLHLGHRSMNFSKFTMSNLNFFGAGVELTPASYRFSAMVGRLAKAEPINLSLTTPNLPVYARTAWATKLGVGKDDASIDFVLFATHDNQNSISIPSNYPKQVSPEANLAIGINMQKLFAKKFRLKLEYANSMLSPNALDANSSKKSLTNFIMKKKNSSYTGNAIESSIGYEGKLFNAGVLYSLIESDFKTLGAYFFNKDIMDVQVFTKFGLLKNKLNTNLKFGVQSNNLDHTKATTTRRLIYDIQLAYALKDFNSGFNFTNNSSSISYVLNPQLDSLNAVVVTRDVGLNMTYNIPGSGKVKQSISALANIQNVSDDIDRNTIVSTSKLLLGNLMYTITLPQHWKFSLQSNNSTNEIIGTKLTRIGYGLDISKSFFKNKMSLGINSKFYNNKNDQSIKSKNLVNQLMINFAITKSIRLNLQYAILNTSAANSSAYTENTGNLGINYNFNYKPKSKSKS